MSARVETWKKHIEEAVNACRRVGGDVQIVRFDRPADTAVVAQVEGALGGTLPASLRRLFLDHSAHIEVRWFLPEGARIDGLPDIFCGTCRIAVVDLPELVRGYGTWVEKVFPDPNDPYDVVWHGKLPFLEVGNGDYLAIDLRTGDEAVVYVSHDDGEGHGQRLANGVLAFLDRWTELGCVGAEDWQWMPFLTADGLDPKGVEAQRLRDWMGVDLAD